MAAAHPHGTANEGGAPRALIARTMTPSIQPAPANSLVICLIAEESPSCLLTFCQNG